MVNVKIEINEYFCGCIKCLLKYQIFYTLILEITLSNTPGTRGCPGGRTLADKRRKNARKSAFYRK